MSVNTNQDLYGFNNLSNSCSQFFSVQICAHSLGTGKESRVSLPALWVYFLCQAHSYI